jgi:hypothetical protein
VPPISGAYYLLMDLLQMIIIQEFQRRRFQVSGTFLYSWKAEEAVNLRGNLHNLQAWEGIMKTKQWAALISIYAILTMFSVGSVEAADGTLKARLKYKDPTTGVERFLSSGFVYLHSATKPPPMEKYFSKADYIGSTFTTYASGQPIPQTVPEGTYYIRITQRTNIPPTDSNKLGPPQAGDYTWSQTAPITIVAGQILDLGTLYAMPFGPSPITISGTVKNQNGTPVAGRYVRAQTTPCFDDGYNNNINQCGPAKYLALKPTDANGTYMIILKDPGAYYIYTSPCITADHDDYSGNRCTYTAAPGPVIVKLRDTATVNMIVFTP